LKRRDQDGDWLRDIGESDAERIGTVFMVFLKSKGGLIPALAFWGVTEKRLLLFGRDFQHHVHGLAPALHQKTNGAARLLVRQLSIVVFQVFNRDAVNFLN
jgi:hypothetical protein